MHLVFNDANGRRSTRTVLTVAENPLLDDYNTRELDGWCVYARHAPVTDEEGYRANPETGEVYSIFQMDYDEFLTRCAKNGGALVDLTDIHRSISGHDEYALNFLIIPGRPKREQPSRRPEAFQLRTIKNFPFVPGRPKDELLPKQPEKDTLILSEEFLVVPGKPKGARPPQRPMSDGPA